MDRQTNQFPAVEVHRSQFSIVGLGDVNIQRLALIDERAAIGRHLNDDPLRNLPHGLVQRLQIGRYSVNVLTII